MIRPASTADIPEIIRLSEIMHQESRYRTLPYNGVKFSALLRRLIDSPEGMVAVAEKDGAIIGAIARLLPNTISRMQRFRTNWGFMLKKPIAER